MDDIELIDDVSRHPIYGIVSEYGQICIKDQWYLYDGVKDRLVRSSSRVSQEDLFHVDS